MHKHSNQWTESVSSAADAELNLQFGRVNQKSELFCYQRMVWT